MIVVNLYFIKHTNGLFHYGLDYAEALAGDVREVWVRADGLAAAVAARLPGVTARVMTPGALAGALLALRKSRDLLFTPSSHPLAFAPRQVVVVHDAFPFEGRAGRVKLALFRAGIALSGAVAGYVNRADAGALLHRLGMPARRTRYLPNRLAAPRPGRAPRLRAPGAAIAVGLFGSDSPKKNYDALFEADAAASATDPPIAWRIFGHANDYTRRLQADRPSLSIEVVESDEVTIDAFLDSIDVAASAAIGEGFARPVAAALMRGVPTFLLDTPVFREFYAGSATLVATPRALVDAVRSGGAAPVAFAREGELRAAFAQAVDWLRARAR